MHNLMMLIYLPDGTQDACMVHITSEVSKLSKILDTYPVKGADG